MPIGEGFCHDHTTVMRCLGSLEAYQDAIDRRTARIETKLDLLTSTLNGVKDRSVLADIKKAASDAKSKILFWVIMVAGISVITQVVQYLFKRVGIF